MVIVDLLLEQGGRARKGNGRNYKLGEKGVKRTQWLVPLRCIVDMNWVHPFMILCL